MGDNVVMLIVISSIIALIILSVITITLIRKLKAEKMISSAECEAKKIVDAAKEMAETKKKEVILEGKDDDYIEEIPFPTIVTTAGTNTDNGRMESIVIGA